LASLRERFKGSLLPPASDMAPAGRLPRVIEKSLERDWSKIPAEREKVARESIRITEIIMRKEIDDTKVQRSYKK
jgi:hypothetical protein